MKAIEFEGQSMSLKPPPNWDQKKITCGDLPIGRESWGMFSYWKPSAADLVALNNGAHIRLDMHSHIHPPVALCVEKCVELP